MRSVYLYHIDPIIVNLELRILFSFCLFPLGLFLGIAEQPKPILVEEYKKNNKKKKLHLQLFSQKYIMTKSSSTMLALLSWYQNISFQPYYHYLFQLLQSQWYWQSNISILPWQTCYDIFSRSKRSSSYDNFSAFSFFFSFFIYDFSVVHAESGLDQVLQSSTQLLQAAVVIVRDPTI